MVRSGTAGLNHAFCPTEPEFNAIAGRCAEFYARLLRRTKQLLAAGVYTPPPPKPRPSVGPWCCLLCKEELAITKNRSRAVPSDGAYSAPSNGVHAARAIADLEARRWAREDPPMGG
jgi:hypothetical protein